MEDIPSKVRSLLGIVAEVNLKSESGLEYIEIVVEPHSNPISYRGKFHCRSGSTKQVLEGAALTRFLLEKHGRTWDDVALPGVRLGQLDGGVFDGFRRMGVRSERLPPEALDDSDEDVIERLQLREGGFLKRAAALLFHPAPHRVCIGAYVKIGDFQGGDLRFQDVVEGDLFTQVDRTLDLLYTKYTRGSISYRDDIYRVETFPVPRRAMREAVINALIHRDYAEPTSTQIRVNDGDIEIRNSALLPPDWVAEDTGMLSQPHNPWIAQAFFRTGMIEAWGRGIRQITERCREAGNPTPTWTREPGGVLCLRFPFSEAYLAAAGGGGSADRGTTPITTPTDPITTPKTGPIIGPKTSRSTGPIPVADRILALLEAEPGITQSAIAERLGLTVKGVKYHFRKLREAGAIRRAGSSRSGHWEVLAAPADSIERMGTGTVDMIRRCTEAGLPEPEFEVGAGFLVRIRRSGRTAEGNQATVGKRSGKDEEPATQKTTQITDSTTQKTTQITDPTTQKTTQERILECLRAEPELTRSELAERTGITPDGVKYHLRKLKADGTIRRVGSDRDGRWVVTDRPDDDRNATEDRPAEGQESATTQNPVPTTQIATPSTQIPTQKTTQKKILSYLRAEPSLTRRELAERTGITPDGIKYHLKELKAAGAIRRVGSDRAGRWKVLEESATEPNSTPERDPGALDDRRRRTRGPHPAPRRQPLPAPTRLQVPRRLAGPPEQPQHRDRPPHRSRRCDCPPQGPQELAPRVCPHGRPIEEDPWNLRQRRRAVRPHGRVGGTDDMRRTVERRMA